MEAAEKHSRCPWDGLKANDRLISSHWTVEEIQSQRKRCREWLGGETSWTDVLGEP